MQITVITGQRIIVYEIDEHDVEVTLTPTCDAGTMGELNIRAKVIAVGDYRRAE